jgi:tRNA G18 (ribose-2'-O)-methylase SpoU
MSQDTERSEKSTPLLKKIYCRGSLCLKQKTLCQNGTTLVRKINFYCATLQNSTSYHTQDFTMPSALVVGTEATGLSKEWREAATQNIIIPMQGEIDSMNVSVAAAILIFEAKRQRGF